MSTSTITVKAPVKAATRTFALGVRKGATLASDYAEGRTMATTGDKIKDAVKDAVKAQTDCGSFQPGDVFTLGEGGSVAFIVGQRAETDYKAIFEALSKSHPKIAEGLLAAHKGQKIVPTFGLARA